MEIYAHRGSRLDYARTIVENTMEAFRCALEEEQCDGIECDLRMSCDGVLVIHHDPATHGTNQVIRDTNYNGLRTSYNIPRLEEVFLLLKQTGKHCFLELKESDATILGKLILLMHEMRMQELVTCIGFPEHEQALLHLATTHGFRIGLIPRGPVDVLRALRRPFSVIMLGWTSAKERKLFLRFAFFLPFSTWLIRRNNKETVAGVINASDDIKIFLLRGINRIITDNVPEALLLRNSLAEKEKKH